MSKIHHPYNITMTSNTGTQSTEASSPLEPASLVIPSPPSPLKPAKLEQYRISHDTAVESIKIQAPPKVLKPSKTTWFQTYPDETAWQAYCMFAPDDSFSSTLYVVAPAIAHLFGSAATRKCLVPCMTRDNQLFFWPLAISDRANTWNDSARIIAGEARQEWRRMEANSSEKRYDAYKPTKPLPSPVWPAAEVIHEHLARALDDRMIDSPSHPEVTKLLMA